MPYTSAMKRVAGGTTLRNINVQVANASDLDPAQQQIIALLRQRHNIRAGRDDDFTVRTQEEIADDRHRHHRSHDQACLAPSRAFRSSSAASAS